MKQLPIVGVMGSGVRAHADLAAPLGRRLARLGVHLLTGGGRGVMASVSRAFAEVEGRAGLVIGILPHLEEDGGPASPPRYPNRWVELPIRTQLGKEGAEPDSRNHVNVLTSDVVVALPGSSGTASEVDLAIHYGRPLILLGDLGRARNLPRPLATASTVDEVIAFVGRSLIDAGPPLSALEADPPSALEADPPPAAQQQQPEAHAPPPEGSAQQ